MSWINKLKTTLTIITGDGKQYTPNWRGAKQLIGYNVSEFNFPNVEGTFVDRREQLGIKFSLELFFQGEDHLDQMELFVDSSKDKRPWTIIHPFYNVLNVQPSGLNIDNSEYNISKITLTATQTIDKVEPVTNIIPSDLIDEEFEITNSIISDQLTEPDKGLLKDQTDHFYYINAPQIESYEDGETFFSKLKTADEKIVNIIDSGSEAMTSIQDILSAPSDFQQDIDGRLRMISSSFSNLADQIDTAKLTVLAIKNLPNDFKTSFEAFGGSLITSLCRIVSMPTDNDFKTRNDINRATETVLGIYNDFIFNLDKLEIGSGGNPQDYQPSAEILIKLNNLVNFTVSNLFQIAKDAKQERTEVLTEDSDFITLAHRFYGLETDDSTIDELISNNSLGLNGILNIKKGTTITYFV